MRTITFSGEVDGFKKVSLEDSKGKTDEHTFVRVRLEDEDSRVVSLGSRLIISDLDLEKGDQISVSGRNARIDDHDVLVASSIEVDDKLFRVRKHNRPNAADQGTQQGSDTTGASNTSQRGESARASYQQSRLQSNQESRQESGGSANRD